MAFGLSTLDPTEDWDLFDGRDVRDPLYQHYDIVAQTYGTGYTVPALWRSGSELGRSIGDGETVISETTIHIPAAMLQQAPHRRDKITRLDAQGEPLEYWIVWDVNDQTFATRYRLTCSKSLS